MSGSTSDVILTHNAGLTSCLSVRLHEIVAFRAKTGRWPVSVDSAAQFALYFGLSRRPIDGRLLRPLPPEQPDFPLPDFQEQYQFRDYSTLDPLIFPVVSHYCSPSAEVEQIASEIDQRMSGRTIVHYRGNDKVKERPRIAYGAMFEAARKFGGPYWVLTDEEEFRVAFYERFPDTDHLQYLPAIKRDPNASVIGLLLDRPLFAVRFLAALYAARRAERLVVTTGNTAMWTVLWRGHAAGVAQLR